MHQHQATIPSRARRRGRPAMFLPLIALAGGLALPSLAQASAADLEIEVMPELWATMPEPPQSDENYFALSGDFNGDGLTDIARVRGIHGVTAVDVLVSTGDDFDASEWTAAALGGFWPQQKYLVADCNGDGRDDIVRVFDDGGSTSIDVLHSTGSAFTYARYATQVHPWDADHVYLSGDFNDDGYGEVVHLWRAANYRMNVDVLESDGESFASVRWATSVDSMWPGIGWASGDFDGDGDDDIARLTDDGGANSVDMLWADADLGSFGYARYATQVGMHVSEQLAAGDFDGDGLDDIGLLDLNDPKASVLIHENSTLAHYPLLNNNSLSVFARDLVGDYDGDGKAEVATVYREDGALIAQVFTPEGHDFDGEPEGYTPAIRWAGEQGSFGDEQLYFSGDFDGDGAPDVARVYNDLGGTTVDVHVNTGDGLAQARWITRTGGHWGGMNFAVGDFDGDGTCDLVKAWNHSGSTSLDVYLSDGDGFPGFST